MPRYFFDVATDARRICDRIGIDLPDAHAIWPEIARLVHDCGPTTPLTPAGRTFDVVVRDGTGAIVERCTSHPTAKEDPG